MPATFTLSERERIEARMRQVGYKLFTTQGLKETSLEEITTSAGVAKSSFYVFFASKEQLYLELLAAEAPAIKKRVLAIFEREHDARKAIESFLRTMFQEFETNLLTKRLITHRDELELIARKVTPEDLERKFTEGQLPVQEFIRRMQKQKKIISGDPAVLEGTIRSVFFLLLHQDELGAHYPAVLEQMIQVVARGLATKPK
jgi:AcrR family transcriptional regulator